MPTLKFEICFFYYMQNKAQENERKYIKDIIDGIDSISETDKISTKLTNVNKLQQCIFVQVKQFFDSIGGWNMTRLDITLKQYMQKNYEF